MPNWASELLDKVNSSLTFEWPPFGLNWCQTKRRHSPITVRLIELQIWACKQCLANGFVAIHWNLWCWWSWIFICLLELTTSRIPIISNSIATNMIIIFIIIIIIIVIHKSNGCRAEIWMYTQSRGLYGTICLWIIITIMNYRTITLATSCNSIGCRIIIIMIIIMILIECNRI